MTGDGGKTIRTPPLLRTLAGKTGIVTGAAGGIGRNIACTFAGRGARVALVDIDSTGLEETAAMIEGDADVATILADTSDAGAAQEAVARAVDRYGTVDFLVNNAAWYVVAPLGETRSADWDRTLDNTLKSVFLMCKGVAPVMTAAGGGAIVNIASVNQLVANPNHSAYTAAKGGVHALTKQIAVEHGPAGIRCNSISPGLILTEAIEARMSLEDKALNIEAYPVGRLGACEDVSHAAAFLASDEASFISGIDLPVDGGLTSLSAAAVVSPTLRRMWGRRPLHPTPEEA